MVTLGPGVMPGSQSCWGPTLMLRAGSFWWKRKSQMSKVPSDLEVKNTAGFRGLQHVSSR